jgi:uncharacterized membrane protein
MEDILKKWLFDPIVGKIVFSLAAILFTLAVVRFAQRILARYVQNTERRYRLKKIIGILGFILAIFLISIIYS